MAEVIKTTFQLKRGIAAAWTRVNPILKQGEPGYELDTGKLKIGDGATAWNNLNYFKGGVDEVLSKVYTKQEVDDKIASIEGGSLNWESF